MPVEVKLPLCNIEPVTVKLPDIIAEPVNGKGETYPLKYDAVKAFIAKEALVEALA